MVESLGRPLEMDISPDGRHVYALESASRNGYGTGVVQMMRRH